MKCVTSVMTAVITAALGKSSRWMIPGNDAEIIQSILATYWPPCVLHPLHVV